VTHVALRRSTGSSRTRSHPTRESGKPLHDHSDLQEMMQPLSGYPDGSETDTGSRSWRAARGAERHSIKGGRITRAGT